MQHNTVILGFGNPLRGDDGIGNWVINEVQAFIEQTHVLNVAAIDGETRGLNEVLEAKGAKRLFIVDACKLGLNPGTYVQVPYSELDVTAPIALSIHDFQWYQGLQVLEKLHPHLFPQEVCVFLIEAGPTGLGSDISQSVKQAGIALVEALKSKLAS